MAEPWEPNWKPEKRTPEQRHAAKQQREPNPLKPTFAKKPKSQGLHKTELAKVGAFGKRNAAADKKAAEECHNLSCVCGCQLPPMWCHLDGRSEGVRHDPVYSVPG